jgi:hypothetical protein
MITPTDTGADRDHGQPVRTASGAVAPFPERGRVRIVDELDRHPKALLQWSDHVGRSPARKGVRVIDDAGGRVDRASDRQADSVQRPGHVSEQRRE